MLVNNCQIVPNFYGIGGANLGTLPTSDAAHLTHLEYCSTLSQGVAHNLDIGRIGNHTNNLLGTSIAAAITASAKFGMEDRQSIITHGNGVKGTDPSTGA